MGPVVALVILALPDWLLPSVLEGAMVWAMFFTPTAAAPGDLIQPRFVTIPASRLSTNCWSVIVGIFAQSAKRAFLRSGIDVGNEDTGSKSVFPKMLIRIKVRALCAGRSNSSTPNFSNHVFMELHLMWF